MIGFRRRIWSVVCLVVVLLALGCSSCSGQAQDDSILTTGEAKRALQVLPYRFSYKGVKRPRGATEAFAARVYGRYRIWFDFGISLGFNGDPVPIPPSGVMNAVGNGEAGFVYTDNLLVRDEHGKYSVAAQIRTRAQYKESLHMATEIEETLCKAATGEPCPAV
jgi:hypothetical protein